VDPAPPRRPRVALALSAKWLVVAQIFVIVIFPRSNFWLPSSEDPEMEQGGTEKRREYEFAGQIIVACIEAHRHLRPRLLESAYEHCLTPELGRRGFRMKREGLRRLVNPTLDPSVSPLLPVFFPK
jgi:hypothetical protein